MKFGCSIGIFLNLANLVCRSTDISKCFRGFLRLRDNESQLYNLHHGWCMGRLFTVSTRHSSSCREGKINFKAFLQEQQLHSKRETWVILRSFGYSSLSSDPDMIWLVGCFGLNGPLRQYFSLYRAVSQREGERKEK